MRLAAQDKLAGGLARLDWNDVLVRQGAASAVATLGCTALWGLTGAGTFWPGWVCFGLLLALALTAALRWAWAQTPGLTRRLAVQGAVSAVALALEIGLWAGTDVDQAFWPMWSALGYSLLLGAHWLGAVSWFRLHPEREQRLNRRVEELTRTRRGALDVEAAELRRIERDLHDGAQARLVALSMQLGRAEERMADQPELAAEFRRARDETSAVIGELRDLARGIAPPILADRGLPAAVDALGRRAPIDVTAQTELADRPVAVIETAAYFVVAEALTNAVKHGGGAPAHVVVSKAGDRLTVSVRDEGPGGAQATPGGGLDGLRTRVEALDGTLSLVSAAGAGTTVTAELPCA